MDSCGREVVWEEATRQSYHSRESGQVKGITPTFLHKCKI